MIKKIIIFIICTVLAVLLLCSTIEHPLRPLNMDTSIHSIEVFHQLEPQTVDVLVMGSSHAWCGIDTGMLEHEYGIKSYNYGCAWQHINTTKLFLQDALLSQSPKMVIIDTDVLGEPMRDSDMGGEIYYTRKIGALGDKLDYLQSCFGNKPMRYITYMFPAIKFHENWKELAEESFLANSNETDFFATRGYLGTDSIEEVDLSGADQMEQMPLSVDTQKFLDDILAICEKNGIKLILCTIPYQGETSFENAAKEYATTHNIEYINFFDKNIRETIGLDELTDFRNPEHLNNDGTRKVTEYLKDYLK